MDRRQFLAAAGGAGLLSVVGLREATASTTLSDPEREVEDDGETHLFFADGDERLLAVTVQPPHFDPDPVPVDVSLWHPDGTTITGVTLRLRAPPAGHEVPADVSLTAPQWSPHPSVELYADGSGGTVFEIADTGGQGQGTMTFEFLVDPVEGRPDELHVDATVDVERDGVFGRTYRAEGLATVPL